MKRMLGQDCEVRGAKEVKLVRAEGGAEREGGGGGECRRCLRAS